MHNRFRKIRNILIVVLALNWIVAAAKVLYGYASKCAAMGADGFHSFSDGTSNIIGLIGIWIASQPMDEDHPYGHKKYETFASIIIAILLFIIAFNIIEESIDRFHHPVLPEVTSLSFIIMLFTIVINTAVFAYEYAMSKILKSDILRSDSFHTRSDILISLSVIFTLFTIKAGFPMMDTLVSLVIAAIIAYGAFSILKESSNVLCDKAVIPADDIKDIVIGIEGVKNCHRIRTRGRFDDIHVDLHVVVDKDMQVGDSHELNHKIQQAIKGRFTNVTNISIHIEPDTEC